MADKPGTALEAFDASTSSYPVLFNQDGEGSIAEILADNFGDEGFSASDLDRLTVPAGGGTSWEIPDEDPTRKITGVIIHKQQTRSMWIKKRGEDGEEDGPPDCFSNDGKVGIGMFGAGSADNPSGECVGCPMNVFGSSTSGSGNGKACKEQQQLFLLREGSILPTQISLPPTSLKGFRKFMTRLVTKAKSYYGVTVELTLRKEKGGGQEYSVVDFAAVSDLAPAERLAARAYGETIASTVEAGNAAREAMAKAEADEVAASQAAG